MHIDDMCLIIDILKPTISKYIRTRYLKILNTPSLLQEIKDSIEDDIESEKDENENDEIYLFISQINLSFYILDKSIFFYSLDKSIFLYLR